MQYVPQKAALLLAVSLSIAGCGESPSVASATVRSVKIQRASAQDDSAAALVGIARSANRADLSFVDGGLVDKVLVDVGQTVKRGQTLAVLQRSVQAAALRAAQADKSAAEGALEAQRRDTERQLALHKAGEASESALATAKANLEAAMARRDSAATSESEARWKYENAAIVAPFDGTITARSTDPGATAPAGQAVLSVENPDRLQVVLDMPASLADAVKPGDVLGATSSRTSTALQLKLESIGKSVTGTGTVKAIFDLLGGHDLKTGEGVRVLLQRQTVAGTSIPIQAVVFGASQGKGDVFVFDPNHLKVQKRAITFKPDDSGRVQITSGVQSNDWVVVAGASQLQDGQAAKAINGEDSSSEGQAK